MPKVRLLHVSLADGTGSCHQPSVRLPQTYVALVCVCRTNQSNSRHHQTHRQHRGERNQTEAHHHRHARVRRRRQQLRKVRSASLSRLKPRHESLLLYLSGSNATQAQKICFYFEIAHVSCWSGVF